MVYPIDDSAEITGGVRDLFAWVEEAKISPAAGLTVTAVKLGRQLKAGHELGKILGAARQRSEAGGRAGEYSLCMQAGRGEKRGSHLSLQP